MAIIYGSLDHGSCGKSQKKWSDSGHILKVELTEFSDGFPVCYVGNKRGIMNDLGFVLEQLKGWTCHLLR